VLEQEGPGALTLDHVARRLGRSHHGGAASLPWPSERWLRSDLAAQGFRRLGASIAESIASSDAASSDPVEQVLAAGRAYVRAAVRNPALYSLMHQPERVDFSHAELARDSAAAFDQLRRFVASLQAIGFQVDRDLDELARIVWESAHRLATRWADAALSGPVEAATVDEAIDLELTLLLGDSPKRGNPHEDHGRGDGARRRACT
jgi:hypothetical protein